MIFIDNKYSKWYFSIIHNARSRLLDNTKGYEKHHVIPESFFKLRVRKGPPGWIDGDPNCPENQVFLTTKEHFVCHVLLTKCTENKAKSKMINALIGMKRKGKNTSRYFNSRLYESAKLEFAKISSAINLGRKTQMKQRQRLAGHRL